LIDRSAPHYLAAKTKLEKTQVIAAVIDTVRRESPRGGFVKKDFYSSRWHEIGDEKARDKVGHAIRKAAEQLQASRAMAGSNPSRGHANATGVTDDQVQQQQQQYQLSSLSHYPTSAIPQHLQISSSGATIPSIFGDHGSSVNTRELLAQAFSHEALLQDTMRIHLSQQFGSLQPNLGVSSRLLQHPYQYTDHLRQNQLPQLTLEQQAMLNSSLALRARNTGLPAPPLQDYWSRLAQQSPMLALSDNNASNLHGRFSSLQESSIQGLPPLTSQLDPLASFGPYPGSQFRETLSVEAPSSVPSSNTLFLPSNSAILPRSTKTPPISSPSPRARQARRGQPSKKAGDLGGVAKESSTDEEEDRKIPFQKK
jgi:hypothetical protein